MSVYITNQCINCGACVPDCPTEAISEGDAIYVIDPELCAECYGHYDHHACQAVCPVDCCLIDPQQPETLETVRARAAARDPATRGRWTSADDDRWFAKRTDMVGHLAADAPARVTWEVATAAREDERRAAVERARQALVPLHGSTSLRRWRAFIDGAASIPGGLVALAPEVLTVVPARCYLAVVAALRQRSPEAVPPEATLRAAVLAHAKGDHEMATTLASDVPLDGLPKLESLAPGLLRRALGKRLKSTTSEEERWGIALLAARHAYRRELRQALRLLMGGRPRLWRHLNASAIRGAPSLVTAVADDIIKRSPSGWESLQRNAVRRVRGGGYYVEACDALVDSLEDAGWDPDHPERREAEARRMSKQLPYAHIARGTVKPRRRSAINNPGVEWEVRWSETLGSATVVLHIAGDEFPETISRVTTMAKALRLAKQRAEDAQAQIDENLE